MADIAASDVTHTVGRQLYKAGEGYKNEVTIAFGNGALTYPSGGVPLTAAKMGCPNALVDFIITDGSSGTGILWKYDKTNNKLRGYEGDYAQAGDASLVELDAASDAPAAQTIKGWAYGY